MTGSKEISKVCSPLTLNAPLGFALVNIVGLKERKLPVFL